MPRPKKSEKQVQAMRDRILDAAYEILQQEGPEAISIRGIAELLDVAHMSLYTYFDNQATILSALREREMAQWREQLRVFEQHAQNQDMGQVVVDMLRFFIAFARDNPNLYRLAWVMPETAGESPQQTHLRMRDTVEQLAGLLAVGMERGDFEPREPFLAAVTVLGMVNMPYILFHSGKLIDPVLRDRLVEEVLSAAMLYLMRTVVSSIL